jgi:hypothetical protein
VVSVFFLLDVLEDLFVLDLHGVGSIKRAPDSPVCSLFDEYLNVVTEANRFSNRALNVQLYCLLKPAPSTGFSVHNSL